MPESGAIGAVAPESISTTASRESTLAKAVVEATNDSLCGDGEDDEDDEEDGDSVKSFRTCPEQEEDLEKDYR